jgi:hypothetical protein
MLTRNVRLAGALALAACASARNDGPVTLRPPGAAGLDDTLRVTMGRSAVTRDSTVRVTFTAKRADSRCAVNVVCVWAGDVAVDVSVETPTTQMSGAVHTAVDPKAFWAGEHQVTLLDVTPRPGEAAEGKPVVATLRVQRAPR